MNLIKKIVKLVQGFLKAMGEDHVSAYAAQAAYFIMLSFVPFVILLLTLIQYTALTKADLFAVLKDALPDVLTEEQKSKKLSNLLQKMKKDGLLDVRGIAVNSEWDLSNKD